MPPRTIAVLCAVIPALALTLGVPAPGSVTPEVTT